MEANRCPSAKNGGKEKGNFSAKNMAIRVIARHCTGCKRSFGPETLNYVCFAGKRNLAEIGKRRMEHEKGEETDQAVSL